jgi:L-seryl-tRNA(Ser) seleniumtransferase
MATAGEAGLRARAEALGDAEPCRSVSGGGTLPGVTMASWAVTLPGDRTGELRRHEPPVVARVEAGRTICDLRTVLPEQDEILATALKHLPRGSGDG